MFRIGLKMIDDRRKAVLAGNADTETKIEDSPSIKDGGKDFDMKGKDLLTLLVKANMEADLTDSNKMEDEDVLARTHIAHLSPCVFTNNHNRGPNVPRRWARNHVDGSNVDIVPAVSTEVQRMPATPPPRTAFN